MSVFKQTPSRELRQMGYRRLSAWLRHHAQAAGAIETLKSLPARLNTIQRAAGVGANGVGV